MFELVIVITIIGIVSTIAIPKFADAGSGRRLSAAKKTLLEDIEFAKLRARSTSKMHLIKFYPGKDIYIIVEGTDINREAVILKRDFAASPYTVDLSRTNLGADNTAVFTVYGDASPAFRVGLQDHGAEITVDIEGVEDVGVTPVVNIVVDEVEKLLADVGSLLGLGGR
tara:strand:+ start:69480 stop:69986 length:507 start_codon:yes stop_codon:yes gene_type:complete